MDSAPQEHRDRICLSSDPPLLLEGLHWGHQYEIWSSWEPTSSRVGFIWHRPNGWEHLGASSWSGNIFGSKQKITGRSNVHPCWDWALACIYRTQFHGHLMISAGQNVSPEKTVMPPVQPVSEEPKTYSKSHFRCSGAWQLLQSHTEAKWVTAWRPSPGIRLSFPLVLSILCSAAFP